jgi:hypothetical protein
LKGLLYMNYLSTLYYFSIYNLHNPLINPIYNQSRGKNM